MNVLLLGNGFDIYHCLPTKYNDFLQTVDFLNKYYQDSMQTVSDVFGDKRLQDKNEYISKCYDQHSVSYNKIKIDKVDVDKIIDFTKTNIWFSYLLKSLNKDVGWIDFEKEISIVIQYFQEFFKNKKTIFAFKREETALRHVLMNFGFFFEKYDSGIVGGPSHRTTAEYTIEEPFGSKNIINNKEKITERLSHELSNLTEALKLYLIVFVENTLDEIKKEDGYERCLALSHMDNIISFNYTNTYEKLYYNKPVFHIHGKTDESIVLGINPNKDDNIETIDTLFVSFKKYFQRSLIESDTEYLKWLDEVNEEHQEISLLIMGHSLDITDEDVITEQFYNAHDIIVLYHSIEAKASYISNLIKIFGKDEFDELRKNKHLKFLPINMDFTEFVEERKARSFENFTKDLAALL